MVREMMWNIHRVPNYVGKMPFDHEKGILDRGLKYDINSGINQQHNKVIYDESVE